MRQDSNGHAGPGGDRTGLRAPAACLAALLVLGGAGFGAAQTPPAPAPPLNRPIDTAAPADTDYAPPITTGPRPIAATGYVFPDLPDSWADYTTYDGRRLSARFSMVPLVDYNAFVQDDESKAQVGDQEDQWDLRTLRLMLRGRMKFRHPVDYLISLEVKGKDHVSTDDSKVGFTDLEVSTRLGSLGLLRVGKIKEPFVYEMVGDAANLQQQERALGPFFASRGIGARLTNTFADDTMSWSIGWYNDWWVADQAFNRSGNNVAGRFTWLPSWTDGGASFLHLGVAGRYVGADEGTLRFRGRPESNVSSYYVDSDSLVGDHATSLGLETVWGRGPALVSAEYARSWVDAAASGRPEFWGGYVVVSYVLTGEHRPYDKTVAYARRVLPVNAWGAWEVVGRYSHVDLRDRLVDGGIFDRGTVGLNWWATRRWKVGVDYGLIQLDRFDTQGLTHAIHTRIQWVY